MKKGVTYKFTSGEFLNKTFTYHDNHIKIDTGAEPVYWYDFKIIEVETYTEV